MVKFQHSAFKLSAFGLCSALLMGIGGCGGSSTTDADAPSPSAGTTATTSLIIGVAIFKFGAKINIRLFFQILGTLLLILSGLVLATLSALDLANTVDKVLDPATGAYQFLNPPQKIVPWFSLGAQVTDTSAILPQGKFPGIIFATLFGYSDRLYALQVVSYVLFLSVAAIAYFRTLAGKSILPLLQRATV